MASYIPGFVLQKYNTQFAPKGGSSVGAILEIPTPDNGAVVDGDFWAIPVNTGVYAGWTFQPYNVNNPAEAAQPVMSVAVCRISSSKTSDVYYVLGTVAQYVTAAAGGTALPAVWPTVAHTVPLLPVCQTLSGTDADGNYIGEVGVPSDEVGGNYFPFGFFNGVALASATANGYADLTALLVFLNASWSTVGTWTKTADNLSIIVTQTGGPGTDVFCGGIAIVHPSL